MVVRREYTHVSHCIKKKKTIYMLMPEGFRNILFLLSSDFCFK